MIVNTLLKGEIAQLKVELRANEKGYTISRPTIPARYDLVVDDGNKLYKVQVKYTNRKSNNSKGSYFVNFNKQNKNNGKSTKYSKEEIDAIAVYVEQIDKVLWFPPEKFDGKGSITIRVEEAKNGQKKCNNAKDFLW